jgi:intein/homing endonuclease
MADTEIDKMYIPPDGHNEVLEAEEHADEEELGDNPEPKTANAAALARQSAIKIDPRSFEVTKFLTKDGKTGNKIKAKKSDFIHNFINLFGEKFDFTGRNYLLPIYDSGINNILLMTGRQVEKTVLINSDILMSDGSYKKAIDINIGDKIAQLNTKNHKIVSGKIVWKSKKYIKSCLRIKTRLGHKIEVAKTHPVRLWDSWIEAGRLSVGDRLATVRKSGSFTNKESMYTAVEINFLALWLGDGSREHKGRVQFGKSGKPAEDYQKCLDIMNIKYSKTQKILKNGNTYTKFSHKTPTILKEAGLQNCLAGEKFIPNFVFTLDEKRTKLFLNRLWSTDGSMKQVTKSQHSIEYSSMSFELTKSVQSILWKFGIPSRIRENWPNYYKNQDIKKMAYILRIETQDGVKKFIEEIGAIGKSEKIAIPCVDENNNRDTYPIECNDLIKDIYKSHKPSITLFESNLRQTLKYPPTKQKIKEYVEYFKDTGYKKDKISNLEQHLDSDVYWDRIVSIEDIGEQECVDFTATDHHNYIVSGIITHNSTMNSNRIVIDSIVNAYYKVLYVSPSHMQTRQFSADRLKPAIEQSPLVAKYFTSASTSNQVFEKGYVNGSMNFLRSAFLNADRCRGLSANLLALDEIQDLIMQNVPVIEEVLSHAADPKKLYTGTPKSFDNTIQQYWERSSQNEWLVPCKRHDPTHWNYLNEKNLGLKGLICNKCGQPIFPAEGKWFKTSTKDEFQGFRISQLMVPWYTAVPEKWKGLLIKHETYPKAQFQNEVLGLSYDSATKPISKGEIMSCCSDVHGIIKVPTYAVRGYANFAGVDWGEGSDGSEKNANGKFKNASYTILTIGTYLGTQFFPFYIRKFEGAETNPTYVEQEIIKTVRAFNVIQTGVDWGHGWGMNERLENALGKQRVIKFLHTGNLKQRRKYEPVGNRYHLSRNMLISEIFELIKKKKILFPRWADFEVYAADLMNVYTEYNEYSRTMKFDHRADQPDDFLHSLIYCHEAANIYYGLGG